MKGRKNRICFTGVELYDPHTIMLALPHYCTWRCFIISKRFFLSLFLFAKLTKRSKLQIFAFTRRFGVNVRTRILARLHRVSSKSVSTISWVSLWAPVTSSASHSTGSTFRSLLNQYEFDLYNTLTL